MKEALLVLFGFVLSFIPTWLDRKRRLKSHWSIIGAEMDLCRERASALLNDSVQSPLYRLPSSAYETSFPVLLAEAALSGTEALTMGRFFSQVEDINRGLDNASAALQSNDGTAMTQEYQRNRLKAEHLIESHGGQPSLYTKAKEVVDTKVAKPWWTY